MTTRMMNLWTVSVLAALILMPIVGGGLAWAETDPNSVQHLFASAGNGYTGTVGVPIEFDASVSYDADGNDITGYYWDWNLDNLFECVSLPKCEHTWHSAFSGMVRVYIFDEQGHLAWDEASVVVTGPETVLQVTAGPNVDLCVTDARRRQVSSKKAEIPGSKCEVLELMDTALAISETVSFPLYAAGKHQIKLVGTNDGSFELNVCGLQDGKSVFEKTYLGEICAGETIVGDLTASCPKGVLEMSSGDLKAWPGLEVDPGKISLIVEPDGTYEVAFTIRETRGRMPLESVTVQCSDITGPGNLIHGSAVAFDRNNFTIEPGGEQEVRATIPVSIAVMGKVSGTITVKCAAGVSGSVDVTLKTPGTFYPHCNGIGPLFGIVGEPVAFDASTSYDPDGYIEHYCWDWDNDGTLDEYIDQAITTHTWDEVHSGTVRLVVFDNDGHAADTFVEVEVTEEEPEP
jgi:PKD domain-containing protein